MSDTRWLWLIRHAKTANPAATRDYDRPLTRRGIADIGLIAARVSAHPQRPTWISSSSALRARTTAEHLNSALEANLVLDDDLYGAAPETLLDAIRCVPDDYRAAAVVAHNPGISYLAALLDPTAQLDGLPTSGTVALSFAGRWLDASFGSLKVEHVWTAKSLRD